MSEVYVGWTRDNKKVKTLLSYTNQNIYILYECILYICVNIYLLIYSNQT